MQSKTIHNIISKGKPAAIGKIGIHLGGPLQILFGIKGRRWDAHDVISKMYNEHWVRPSKSETPENNFAVEGGCYW
jgi:hypothetical protein